MRAWASSVFRYSCDPASWLDSGPKVRFPKYIKRPPLAVLFLSLSYWHSKVWFYWAWYPPSTNTVVFEKVFKRSSERFNEWLYSLPTTHEKKDYNWPPQPALVQIPFFFTLSYPAHCPSGLKKGLFVVTTYHYMASFQARFLAWIKALKPLSSLCN